MLNNDEEIVKFLCDKQLGLLLLFEDRLSSNTGMKMTFLELVVNIFLC